jgi:hypothetical protein
MPPVTKGELAKMIRLVQTSKNDRALQDAIQAIADENLAVIENICYLIEESKLRELEASASQPLWPEQKNELPMKTYTQEELTQMLRTIREQEKILGFAVPDPADRHYQQKILLSKGEHGLIYRGSGSDLATDMIGIVSQKELLRMIDQLRTKGAI